MNQIFRLLPGLLLFGGSVNAQTITETFGSGPNAFSIDFAAIGNPGNTPTQYGYGGAWTGGGVAYSFHLGKYEISRDQIQKANAAGGLGITLADMSLYGGNGAGRPGSGISWFEAARFVNYLNTSQGFTPAYKFNSGAFRLWNTTDLGYDPNNRFRNALAKYVLPSRDEWIKGAFGKPTGGWFRYTTGSDTPPQQEQDSLSGANYGASGAAGTGPSDVNLAGALSAWGTMGQGGNIREWNETAVDGLNDSAGENVAYSGAGWMDSVDMLDLQGYWAGYPPTLDGYEMGFRVALIPEPSSLWLLLTGGAFALLRRRST